MASRPGSARETLSGVRVIDGTGRLIERQDVEIDDGRLGEIVATREVRGSGSADANLTLLPGLINMHSHLTAPGEADRGSLRPFALQAAETVDIQLLRSARNARVLLATGVTTVRDCGSAGRVSQSVRDLIDAGVLTGPRIVSCGRVITTTAGHGWQSGLRADSAGDLRKAVRRLVEEGVDAIKIAVTGGGGTPGSNVFRAQYTRDELEVVSYEAHRLGKRVAAHAHGTEGMRNAVGAGIDTIEHCGWMGLNGGLEVDDSVTDEMLERHTVVVPTMTVLYRAAYDDFTDMSADRRKMRAVREPRTNAWTDMYRRGVRFATGPDTGVNDTYWNDSVRELELMSTHMGLSPMEAIVAATRDSAIGLGLDSEIGTIAAGKAADLLVVEGNPAEDLAALRRVRAVYRSGRLVVRDGLLLD